MNSTRVRLCLNRCAAAAVLAAMTAGLTAALAAQGSMRPEPAAIAAVPAPLLERVRQDLFVYFRFVNRPWIERVCAVFADEVSRIPKVRLHGDAHVEQFVLTRDAWGLDDFDDSTRGPAVVDIVRFLGSVDLATRERGWLAQRDALFDRFFAGYRRGAQDPAHRPPQPSIVRRARPSAFPRREVFLSAGEARMEPMSDAETGRFLAGLHVFADRLRHERPDLSLSYLEMVRAGWLRTGVGSAQLPRVLVRVQGPSSRPDDDELLEVKRARDLSGLSCLDAVSGPPTLRIILGSRQVGRLKPLILMAAPDESILELGADATRLRYWFIRSWDPTYHEVGIADLRSAPELSDIVYDAGLQLAVGNFREEAGDTAAPPRAQALDTIRRLEPRIRTETIALVDELARGWKEFAGSK